MKNLDKETRLIVEKCLSDIPFIRYIWLEQVSSESKDSEYDFTCNLFLSYKGEVKQYQFFVESKTNIPQSNWINSLKKLKSIQRDHGKYVVLVSSCIPDDFAKILNSEGIGYIDATEKCNLCFDSIFIYKAGKKNSKKPVSKFPYTSKAERILRVLLNNPNKTWHQVPLSDEADVSRRYTRKVLSFLEKKGFIQLRYDEGIFVHRASDLLREWAENYDSTRSKRHGYYSLLPVDEIEFKIASFFQGKQYRHYEDGCHEFAFTEFSGASRLAPFVTSKRVTLYISSSDKEDFSPLKDELVDFLNLKKVKSGANVVILAPYDPGILYKSLEVDRAKTVSPVQMYLDLMSVPGRGEEAAQALLKKVIEPQWKSHEEIMGATL